jgi:hypothetical protein
MRKILSILVCILFSLSLVSAWGADRVISGNDVTINVDDTGGTGVFTIQETLTGATVDTYDGVLCGLVGNVLTCDYAAVIQYTTTGSGSVDGTITGGFPSSTIPITGDTIIGGGSPPPQIKINEFESNPDVGGEWVELYNPTGSVVDLTGWTIEDNTAVPADLTGLSIPANGYLVLEGGTDFTFVLNNMGEDLILRDDTSLIIDQTGSLDDGDSDDNTWQRIPNGVDTDSLGDWTFQESTQGITNDVGPDITPPVISGVNVIPSYTSATINWNTDENADSEVEYGLTTSYGSSESEAAYVTSHSISLSGLTESTLYYYEIESCDVSSNCDTHSGNFITLTSWSGDETDDLMVNLVRGKIIIDTLPAPAGTSYKVEVLTGDNAGYEYIGNVDDSLIPSSLDGNGYFDTDDKLGFSTGDDFRVSLVDYPDCYVEDVFENGGNGLFGPPESDLIVLDCTLPNVDPILSAIGNKIINEGQLLQFVISATDSNPLDTLTFDVLPLLTGATLINNGDRTATFSWTPDYDDEGYYDVTFSVDDGNSGNDEEEIRITVNEVNRDPELDPISNQAIDEEASDSYTLSSNDDDGDDLDYSIISEDVNEVDCEGTASCTVEVSDGNGGTDSESFDIVVTGINDAPVLDFISDQFGEETTLLEFTITATDPDAGDNLSFEYIPLIPGATFINNGDRTATFSWTPGDTDEGIYDVVFTVLDDALLYDSDDVRITIDKVNQAPIFSGPIIGISSGWNEDTLQLDWDDLDNYFTDPDGDDLSYSVVNGNGNHITIDIDSDGTVDLTPNLDWHGADNEIVFTASDGSKTADSNEVTFVVDPVDDGPRITGYNPTENPLIILIGTIQDFFVNVFDPEGDSIDYSWTIDNGSGPVTIPGADSPTYNYLFDALGTYTIEVDASNLGGSDLQSWDVQVEDLDYFSCQEAGGDRCSDSEICTGTEWIGSGGSTCCSVECTPSFEGISTCDVPDSRININVKEPDENEEYTVGETILVELEIENNFDEDKDFEIEVYLYDLTDDDEIEEEDDDLDVDEGKDEEIEFELDIPYDVEDNHNFYIFINVEDEDDSDLCNEEAIKIDIEREDYHIIIEDLELSSELAQCGDSISLVTDVLNIGDDDSEFYLTLKNSELGLSQTSQMLELEEFDEDDDLQYTFNFNLPENAEKGTYVLNVEAIFEDGRSSESISLELEECSEPVNVPPVLTLGSPGTSLEVNDKDNFPVLDLEDPKGKGIPLEVSDKEPDSSSDSEVIDLTKGQVKTKPKEKQEVEEEKDKVELDPPKKTRNKYISDSTSIYDFFKDLELTKFFKNLLKPFTSDICCDDDQSFYESLNTILAITIVLFSGLVVYVLIRRRLR